MDYYTFNIIALIFLLYLSAFFSGSETALFALKKSDIHRFSLSQERREQTVYKVMLNPKRILITILIGNLFVNLILSAIATRMLLDRWEAYGHFISIALVTPVIIIFCEITPKVISINTHLGFSKRVIPQLQFFHRLFYPLRVLFLSMTNLLVGFLKLDSEADSSITKEELDMAVEIGENEGIIKEDEGAFIKNVLRFSGKDASNIMIPRNKAVFISSNATIDEAVEIFLKEGILRAPVYRTDLDTIVGLIDSRELVPYVMGIRKAKTVKRLIHDINHFPASRELGDLLADFLLKKIQIAIVIDEYGGTAGVVTLSSILSELMGKEFLQWEDIYKPDILKMDGTTCIISGDMQIEDFIINFKETIETKNSGKL